MPMYHSECPMERPMIHDNKWTNTVTNDTSETVHVAAFNNSDHIPEWLVTAVRVFPKIGGVLAWAFGVLNGALKGTKHTAVLEPGQSTSWGANVYSPNGLVIITTYRPRPDSEIEALAWRASADGDVLRVSQAMAGNPFERSLCGAVDIVDGSIIVLGAPNGQRVGLDKDTPGCALQAVAWHDEVWEQYEVRKHPSTGQIALRCVGIDSGRHGAHWLSALPEGKVLASAPHVREWEWFTVYHLGQGKVALQGHHGTCIRVVNGGNGGVLCDYRYEAPVPHPHTHLSWRRLP